MSPSPAPSVAIDPILNFLRLLWEIEHCLERASKRMSQSIGVTGPQRLVLRVIEQAPGIAPKQLAEVVRLHPSTLTGVLRRLQKKKLITRKLDPVDRRRAILSIRPAAERITRNMEGTVEEAVKSVLAGESRAAIQHTQHVLAHLAEALDALTGEARSA